MKHVVHYSKLIFVAILLPLLVACGDLPTPTPTPDLDEYIFNAQTQFPVIPTEDPAVNLGRSDPFSAGLPAEGQPSPGFELSPSPRATVASLPLEIFSGEGFLLWMAYFSAPRQPAPVIIFFHDAGESSAWWITLAENLQSRGYNVFVPDQRGHGRSEGTVDWLRAIEDVDVYLQTIDQLPIRIQDIMMMGMGEGANVALVSCARSTRCIGAVAISPREFVPAINLDSIVGAYGESRELLLVSADDDSIGSSISNQLQEQVTADAVEWQRYSGGGRGIELFESQSNFNQIVVGWLRNQAQPVSTPVPAQ